MLNVQAVQNNISFEYVEAAKKPSRQLSWDDRNLLDGGWHMECLPKTCSAVEISQPESRKWLAKTIAQALRMKKLYLQCAATIAESRKILEEFGFTKVTEYRGNNSPLVTIYFINLSNYRF